jgi:hypothetical protein
LQAVCVAICVARLAPLEAGNRITSQTAVDEL